jgi:hypothetical protein
MKNTSYCNDINTFCWMLIALLSDIMIHLVFHLNRIHLGRLDMGNGATLPYVYSDADSERNGA